MRRRWRTGCDAAHHDDAEPERTLSNEHGGHTPGTAQSRFDAGVEDLIIFPLVAIALAVKHLRAREVGSLRVVNRSLDRARRLAAKAGAEPQGLDALVSALGQADLVETLMVAAEVRA